MDTTWFVFGMGFVASWSELLSSIGHFWASLTVIRAGKLPALHIASESKLQVLVNAVLIGRRSITVIDVSMLQQFLVTGSFWRHRSGLGEQISRLFRGSFPELS